MSVLFRDVALPGQMEVQTSILHTAKLRLLVCFLAKTATWTGRQYIPVSLVNLD
jgi:hypothetical protein